MMQGPAMYAVRNTVAFLCDPHLLGGVVVLLRGERFPDLADQVRNAGQRLPGVGELPEIVAGGGVVEIVELADR
jgi:hypothetical protein